VVRPESPSADPPPAHDQHGFRGQLEWGQPGVRLLAGRADLVVIVDVLSFSTAVSVAVERGAAVVPYRHRDGSAMDHARSIGAIFASPNRGAPGPTLSPASLVVLRPDETLLLPSPNGSTCALLAAEAGAMVVAGSLRNAGAVGRFAASRGWTTAVIAAGEAWPDGGLRPAVEDLIGAGAILAAFATASLSPEARAAVAAFRDVRDDLAAAIGASASGRELVDAGFERDLPIATELDATELVPVLVDGAFRSWVR
jgi:2-phosphosulfolactate phosphatase